MNTKDKNTTRKNLISMYTFFLFFNSMPSKIKIKKTENEFSGINI